MATVESLNTWYVGSGVTTSIALGNVAGVENCAANWFQLANTITVTAVGVLTGTKSGSPTGNWTVRIETDNAGVPSGTLVDANASVVVTPPAASTAIKATFATPFSLSASIKYWIVINISTQSTGLYWQLIWYGSHAYASGGTATSVDGGVTWMNTDSSYDAWFKVYAQSTDTNIDVYKDDHTADEFDFTNIAYRYAQSWTVGVGITNLSSIKLWLRRNGTLSASSTLTIYASDVNNKPTGSSLGSASFVNLSIPITAGGTEITFTFSPTIVITSGNKYCAVYNPNESTLDGSHYISLYSSLPSNNYSGGKVSLSFNNGSTWTNVDTDVLHFKTYYIPSNPINGFVMFQDPAIFI